MAILRSALRNKFISVNNNYRSTLRQRIGVGSVQVPLAAIPTKLGQFGYTTVDNNNGGLIIFFSGITSNILQTTLADRGQDGTTPVGRRGGTLILQRVIAANVGLNQAALASILAINHRFSIGRRGSDPHRDLLLVVASGYTGNDQYGINAVGLKSTSGIFALGRLLKLYFDRYYVNRMNFNTSASAYGDNLAKQLTVFNTPSVTNAKAILVRVATASYNSYVQASLGSIHINNRLKTPSVRASSYTAYPASQKGAAVIGAFGPTQKLPLVIAAEDVMFVQKKFNAPQLSTLISGVDLLLTSGFGTTMDPDSSLLLNKVQLFNVRSASIYQPYTVIATHYDSKVDSLLLRYDTDYFMSTYNGVGNLSGTGGSLTIRSTVGSSRTTGLRWRVAANLNILVNGSTFHKYDSWLSLSASANLTNHPGGWGEPAGSIFKNKIGIDTLNRMSRLSGNCNIFLLLVDRGWIESGWDDHFFGGSPAAAHPALGRISMNPGLNLTGVFVSSTNSYYDQMTTNIGQFVSYPLRRDKLGKFNLSFFAYLMSARNVYQPISPVTQIGFTIIPVVFDTKTLTYRMITNQAVYTQFDGRLYSTTVNNFEPIVINPTSVSSLSAGYLYSVPMDLSQNFQIAIDQIGHKLVGFFFMIGANGSVNHFGFNQIKLLQGLQRTRYRLSKPLRITSKIIKDSTRNQLVIQGLSRTRDVLNNKQLFISSYGYLNTSPLTAAIDFGKYIPRGHQDEGVYATQLNNKFWRDGWLTDPAGLYMHGMSVMWLAEDPSSSRLSPILRNPEGYTFAGLILLIFGLRRAHAGVQLTQSHGFHSSSDSLDNSIWLWTSDEFSNVGNVGTNDTGHIRLSAYGSLSSNVEIRRAKDLWVQSTHINIDLLDMSFSAQRDLNIFADDDITIGNGTCDVLKLLGGTDYKSYCYTDSFAWRSISVLANGAIDAHAVTGWWGPGREPSVTGGLPGPNFDIRDLAGSLISERRVFRKRYNLTVHNFGINNRPNFGAIRLTNQGIVHDRRFPILILRWIGGLNKTSVDNRYTIKGTVYYGPSPAPSTLVKGYSSWLSSNGRGGGPAASARHGGISASQYLLSSFAFGSQSAFRDIYDQLPKNFYGSGYKMPRIILLAYGARGSSITIRPALLMPRLFWRSNNNDPHIYLNLLMKYVSS